MVEKVSAKEFWAFVDETMERLENWVLENKADINYECCKFACDVLYRIFSEWKIHEKCGRETIDDTMSIMTLWVRNIQHDVLLLFGHIFDPTHMQFNPPLTQDDYDSDAFGEDFSEDCEIIFRDEGVLEICKLIRPELYN